MIIVHQNLAKYWLGVLASIFLGVTFVVAGISKVFAPEGAVELPEILLTLLVIAELSLGLFLVAGIFVQEVAILSLPLIGSFIISNILLKIYGQEECLSCFGAMGKLSVTQALFLDGIMVTLVVVILMWYPGRFFNVRPWYWGEGKNG